MKAKTRYNFGNAIKGASIYCTKAEFRKKHNITLKELNKLFKGEINYTHDMWYIQK